MKTYPELHPEAERIVRNVIHQINDYATMFPWGDKENDDKIKYLIQKILKEIKRRLS